MEKQSLVQEIPIEKRRRDAFIAVVITVICTGFISYSTREFYAALAFLFFGLLVSIFILRKTHDYTKLTSAGELAMRELQEKTPPKNIRMGERWGVTRDSKGNLAYITDWPWYWRYPIGFLIVVFTIFLALLLERQGESPWFVGGFFILGLLFSLSAMYELGFLSIIAAVIGGIWWAFQNFFPEFKVPGVWVDIALSVAVIIALFNTVECLKQIMAVRNELAEARDETRRMFSATNSLIIRSQNSVRKTATPSTPEQDDWRDLDQQDDEENDQIGPI